MTTYHGNKGLYHEANQLGSGGEGTVYSISGNPNSVLKIYHPAKLTSELRRKIELMLSIRSRFNNSALFSLAWPTDIVNDDKGNFAGLVMPKVVGDPINKCYEANDFSVNYEQRICIAKNLCVAVDAVHSAKQTIGDFNPNNIIVNKKIGTVTLVDTDSFHLKNDRGVLFPCTVGLPSYVAPELQGMNFSESHSKTYTQETDRFSLAIHIFCLLMNGTHPFATRRSPINTTIGKSSVVLPPTESLIKNGQSPHFSRKRSGTLPPPYCPDIKMLPSNIRGLFERAFDSGHQNPAMRPSAEEWYDELSVVQRKTRKCLKDNTHIYPDHVKKCPWCEILRPSKNNQSTSSSEEKRNYRLVSMVVYGVLATLYLMSLYKSDDFDLHWGILSWYNIGCLVSGAIATWFTNSYFIKQWPVKGRRKREIPLAIIAGSLACLCLTPIS